MAKRCLLTEDDVEEAINNAAEHEEVLAALEFESDESERSGYGVYDSHKA